MEIKIGDIVTIKGSEQKVKVLGFKNGNIVVDRGYKISQIWKCNILEYTQSEKELKRIERRILTRDKRLEKRQLRHERFNQENISGIHKCTAKTSEIRSIIY